MQLERIQMNERFDSIKCSFQGIKNIVGEKSGLEE